MKYDGDELSDESTKGLIRDRFLGNGLWPYDARLDIVLPNTLVRLPDNDLVYLMDEMNIQVVQISVNTAIKIPSRNLPFEPQASLIPLKQIESDVWFITFETGIFDVTQSQTTYAIAHEFAHAFLGHFSNDDEISKKMQNFKGETAPPEELETDKKVIEWGFEDEVRDSDMSYIYHWDKVKRRNPGLFGTSPVKK